MAKRRANGEGSICKRKDGRWEGRFTVGYREDGKQIYKNVLAKTQAECAKKLKAAIAAAKEIPAIEPASTAYTVAEWIDVWYENFIRPNLRETTKNQYESFIRHHVKPYVGAVPLAKLSSLDLQKLYNKLKTSGRIQTDHALTNPGLSAKTVRSMVKRRANGEGSISKRKDGRWEGRFTVGYREDGKQIYKNVLAKTQAECSKKLKAAIAAANEIPTSEPTSAAYTLAEWIDVWYENFIRPNLRETTRNQYESFIRHHIKPYVGAVPLAKLSSLNLQKLYNKLKTSGRIQTDHALPNPGLSAKTVRSIHMMLSSCLEKAVNERLIPSNPAHGCNIPPKEKQEMKIIPPEQIGRFLQEADKAGYLAMFYLELTSGLRRGELLALLWADVDTANCTISVSKQVIRVNGELKVLPPKTKNAVRKIVLPWQTVDLLISEHERHPDHPLLFPSPKTGSHLDPPAVARKMKTLLARAGIDEIRFHDLRHTFATLSLQNGVDVKTLSHTLGHYSAGFTLDTYTHVTTQMQEDAARKIGGFMAAAQG